MKYKHFLVPFFNHFIQCSPPTMAKLKSLHGVLQGQLPPQKWSHPFMAYPLFDNFKIHPPFQPICSSKSYKNGNYDIQGFPLLLDSSGKPNHQAIHCSTANFGPLSRGSVTNPILITVFETYLTSRSPGSSV